MRLRKTFVLMLFTIAIFNGNYVRTEEIQNTLPLKPLLTVKELPEFRIAKGEVLYSRYCSFCHGESGEADGLNAFSMPVKPLNFNNRDVMAQKSDKELERVILFGGDSQGLSRYMPAFGNTFSDRESRYLIKYIRQDFSGN
jgi:mono/diheme cytochrome c family protein